MLSLFRCRPSSTAGLSVTRHYRGFSYSSVSFADIAKITISGTLVRSPELSTTSSGRQCIRYTIRSYKGGGNANFFNFLLVTDNAKSIEYLTKVPSRSRVISEGQFSPYQLAREDGSKVEKYSIFSKTLHVVQKPEPAQAAVGEATQAQEAPAPTEEIAVDEAAQAQEAPVPTEEVAVDEAAQAQEAPAPTEEVAVDEAAQAQEAPVPTEGVAVDEATQAQEAPAPTEGGEPPGIEPS